MEFSGVLSAEELSEILSCYGLESADAVVSSIQSGLIHSTWKVDLPSSSYVIQRMNTKVFADPAAVCNNSRMIKNFIAAKDNEYLFVCPLETTKGSAIVDSNGSIYRMFDFAKDSRVYDVVESPEVAAAAARSFGKLTCLLSDFDCSALHVSIPDFHSIALRYQQFEGALVEGNKARIEKAKDLTDYLQAQRHIVDAYFDLLFDPNFKLRVTHHDTKISNVLFSTEEAQTPLCVIDLDTTMPGYFISDIGDMIRTYCCSVNEEEEDFTKIDFRDDMYYAVLSGYLSEMEEQLSDVEKECFIFAGKYMIYMQALRFLTDYLLDDVYYGSKYPDHNFVRAGNQIELLKKLISREPFLRENRFKEIL